MSGRSALVPNRVVVSRATIRRFLSSTETSNSQYLRQMKKLKIRDLSSFDGDRQRGRRNVAFLPANQHTV
jgi:hypothetical protein